jgi:hypothetical protein
MLQLTGSWTVDESDSPRAVDTSPQMVALSHRIRGWCKGLRIDATVDVTHYTPEPNTTWEVGLVQILEGSVMRARYGDVIVQWGQPRLPCYDSTDDTCIPWYTPLTGQQITGVGRLTFTLQDYPTSHLDPYLENPGGMGHGSQLTHYVKHNRFNTYLLLRTTKIGQVHDRFLKHCRWNTRVEIRPLDDDTWQANTYDPAGYEELDHSRRTSWTYKVITAAFHSLPPTTAGSANNSIVKIIRRA